MTRHSARPTRSGRPDSCGACLLGMTEARRQAEQNMDAKLKGLALALVFGAVACSQALWGLPRTPVQALSPDGRFIAFVRNHPSTDPPDQSLWLARVNGRPTRLMDLPPDSMWSDEILWSGDSRRVAFVIADSVLLVYEAASAERVFSGFVGRPSRDYPPRYILEDVSLSSDGRAVTFVECERSYVPVLSSRQNRHGTRREPVISGCSRTPITVSLASVPQTQPW